MTRFFPTLTATRLQAAAYLFGIALFSISFLVFLNSSISFVVTDVIGQKENVGDAVGTLGFADELLALVACPVWGLLSDRIGVRTVAVLGYCIVGLSLVCLVQSTNVYPELLLGRLGFSIGGAACSTMVTAVLPTMVARKMSHDHQALDEPRRNSSLGHAGTPSVSSELTITPTRYSSSSRITTRSKEKPATTSQLAGFVGLFTGAGALVALAVFLPLPAYFQEKGETPAQMAVGTFIFFGLRDLPGEEGKSLKALLTIRSPAGGSSTAPSFLRLTTESVKLGFTDSSIGLGYLGGFVARASSVGVSLFIPLFVNAYFLRTGLCTGNPDNLTDIKENCQRAYKLAAALTGIAETAALLGAPLFGYFGARVVKHSFQWPLMFASIVGVLGYVGFGLLHNPDAFHGEDDSRWAILAVIAIGISQIGSIVCSLGILGSGIGDQGVQSARPEHAEVGPIEGAESAPLLPGEDQAVEKPSDRSQLKGTIAGVYSLVGGAAILILTKVGGALFDSWTPGAPFFLMAIFNAALLVAVILIGLKDAARRQSLADTNKAV
ncbi:hypothetical protein AMS68_003332 [Peltaster fructicola]|uniref:Major facilitator superfamily (MFS) profile domain-containing protein n=1 Tax=Peltaster fructicola TaxID=286661 RepID=A0A6H0XT40_9PEZI|nr:hypothetical protein AMS68_003332 [Peltaster fructicola]